MEPHITLSALEPKHLASLEPLWNALFDHHLSIGAAGLPTIPREQSWPLRQAHYARLITHSPQCSIWLAAQEEHPVGYALAYETHDSADPLWVLETLSVLPEYRGAGIGRALLTAVDEDAHTAGIRVCAVDVMGGNPRARDLYLRAGYLPHTETWVRSIPPETSHEPTTTREIAADTLAEFHRRAETLGITLSTDTQPDDTWNVAHTTVELSRPASSTWKTATPVVTLKSNDRDTDPQCPALQALIEDLETAGLWTVTHTLPTHTATEAPRQFLTRNGFRISTERLIRR